MGSRCTTGFHRNTGTVIYEGPLLAPHPGRCVCVNVCAYASWFVQILNECLDVWIIHIQVRLSLMAFVFVKEMWENEQKKKSPHKKV